jgi:hypothetical protein
MRVPPRIVAILCFVVVGMLALVVAGLLDWIVGVLFLLMEFLGEVLRNVFRHRRARRHPPSRSRAPSLATMGDVEHRRRSGRRRMHPRRPKAEHREPDPADPADSKPHCRLMLPLSGDQPGLVAFALEECRVRQAEMLVLFLRPIAIIPMGPIPLPGLSEDEEARATIDRVGSEADRVGVPMRAIYAPTGDRPLTIGEAAGTYEADIVVVGSPRLGLLSRYLTRDSTPSLLRLLPQRTSLLIHAS